MLGPKENTKFSYYHHHPPLFPLALGLKNAIHNLVIRKEKHFNEIKPALPLSPKFKSLHPWYYWSQNSSCTLKYLLIYFWLSLQLYVFLFRRFVSKNHQNLNNFFNIQFFSVQTNQMARNISSTHQQFFCLGNFIILFE